VGIGYPCDQCDYVATALGYLQYHKESMHDDISYPYVTSATMLAQQCEILAGTKNPSMTVPSMMVLVAHVTSVLM